MIKLFFSWLSILLVLIYTPIASASNSNDNNKYTDISIVADKISVLPNETITIGIINNIAPKWHVYWSNPGDSGEELKVQWLGIEGVKDGQIKWPIPKKINYEGLTNYGYENQVILLQDITFPDVIPDGAFNLVADISVLVCKEICIPEYHTLSIEFNGSGAASPDVIKAAKQKMPDEVTWPAYFSVTDNNIQIKVDKQNADIIPSVKDIEILPKTKGFMSHSGNVDVKMHNGTLYFSAFHGDKDHNSFNQSRFLIKYSDDKGRVKGVELEAIKSDANISITNDSKSDLNLGLALLFALLGGLILNLMPCVFPILSLKVLSLVKIQNEKQSKIKKHGLAYMAGVLLSFVIIGGTLLILKAAGQSIGWGFQLQNPIVILMLAYLIFLVGLNLAGFYEITNRFAGFGGKLTENKGLSGSFYTGVLATLVATPCTAPFMGVALGYAVLQPPLIAITIFISLGFGLALPYLLLCFIPSFRKIMPKPGGWMQTFKELLSFPMFATAIWLLWVLSVQTGVASIVIVISGFLTLALGIWIYKRAGSKAFIRLFGIIVIIMSLFPLFMINGGGIDNNIKVEKAIGYTAFSSGELEVALSGDNPVFVNMTAAWCITCKVNEKVALSSTSVQTLFEKNNIEYIVGDWTNYDEEITKFLETYNRNGVPLYVYYGPKKSNGERPKPEILPQILTPGIVEEVIAQ